MRMFPISEITEYQSDSTILCIAKSDNDLYLALQAVHSASGMIMYMMPLCQLNPFEAHLDKGRFKNFDPSRRLNRVTTMVHPNEGIQVGMNVFKSYSDFFTKQVEWCAGESFDTNKTWSFSVETHHVSKVEHNFFFDDDSMAVKFKLCWA